MCVYVYGSFFFFNPPRKQQQKGNWFSSVLCCYILKFRKRNFFGRARSSSRRRSIYKRRSSTTLLCRVGWCHPVSRQTRTRASPIQLLHVRQQQEGVGEQGANGIQHGRRFYWHRSSRPSRRPSPHPAVKTTKFFTKERKGKKQQSENSFFGFDIWFIVKLLRLTAMIFVIVCVRVCGCVAVDSVCV
jgi:hypothetical protein